MILNTCIAQLQNLYGAVFKVHMPYRGDNSNNFQETLVINHQSSV